MDSFWMAAGSAAWLGILTSLSPCPMATNIAAVSYIGKRVDRPWLVFSAGLLYTLGRTITYIGLAILVLSAALAIPDLAMFLQRYMNRIIGPVLIVVGLVLLDLVRFRTRGVAFSQRLQQRLAGLGVWGAALLGLLFALSFCPVSAALYFGSLMPIALEHQSRVLVPMLYGIGTALPVVGFSLLIAFSARAVGAAFQKLSVIDKWARRITGAVFVLVGIYYCLIYWFGLPI